MFFEKTKIEGAFIIEIEKKEDFRGFFARTWCRQEFQSNNLNPCLEQCSLASNKKRGTIRGIHFQISPFEEAKLLRCIKGSIFDVVIDLRPESKSYKQVMINILTSENYKMLYVPEGCPHGYQTLENNTEIFYQISKEYAPDFARGIRWNDPEFKIPWPIPHPIILNRDNNYPDFKTLKFE